MRDPDDELNPPIPLSYEERVALHTLRLLIERGVLPPLPERERRSQPEPADSE